MFRNLILLLNLWIVLAERNPQDPKETQLLNRTPLVLTENMGSFHFPKRVRITQEHQKQQYYFSKERDSRYYCPIEHTIKNKELLANIKKLGKVEYQYCLFKKKKFDNEEEPMCEDEAKPLIVEKRDNYGQSTCGTGYMYKFAYEVCISKSVKEKALRWARWRKAPKADLFADVHHPHLYEICYEHFTNLDGKKISGRVLFTEHKIRSPYMLRNLNLYDEHSLHKFSEYYSTEAYGLDNLISLKGNLKAFLEQGDARKYELEMLVPSADFALGHWKKTTYHLINYAPLHGWAVYLWRAITAYISDKIIELYKKIGTVRIFTGTFGDLEDSNGQKEYLGNDQTTHITIPLIWWKLLYTRDEEPKKAVVVIMHTVKNFKKVCKEETSACNISKWRLNLDHEMYKNIYVYCCKVSTAKEYINTILHLRINLENIELLELD